MKGVTTYQLELLQRLVEIYRETGKLADFDQLLTRLSWNPTKESAQFTIRAVIKKGFVEKTPLEYRRGRKRVCFRVTEQGMLVLDPRGVVEAAVEAKAAESLPTAAETEQEILNSGVSDIPEMEILED